MHKEQYTHELMLADTAATERLGALLAECVCPGMVIYLEGDLGAGKTTLARALLRKTGFSGSVKSPTYSLVEVYVVSRLYLYHFDFYRFLSPEEFTDAGLDEYFRDDAICLVEWPEKAAGYIPPADLRLAIQHHANGRCCAIVARGKEGLRCLNFLREKMAVP